MLMLLRSESSFNLQKSRRARRHCALKMLRNAVSRLGREQRDDGEMPEIRNGLKLAMGPLLPALTPRSSDDDALALAR